MYVTTSRKFALRPKFAPDLTSQNYSACINTSQHWKERFGRTKESKNKAHLLHFGSLPYCSPSFTFLISVAVVTSSMLTKCDAIKRYAAVGGQRPYILPGGLYPAFFTKDSQMLIVSGSTHVGKIQVNRLISVGKRLKLS